jgi:hypothetical protein
MDPARTQRLLATLYDRLFDAVTYSPEGKSTGVNRDEIYFQLAKNVPFNPSAYEGMFSPLAPDGDMAKAEAFSKFVDAIPVPNPLYAPTGKNVSDVYKDIMTKADTDTTSHPDQVALYKQAYDFLNVEVEVKTVQGTKKKVVPSDMFVAYQAAQSAYVGAVKGYRNAYNGYDLTKKEDQRAFNADAPMLQLAIDQAWSNWRREGKDEIEEALQLLGSTINDALRSVIEDSQKLVSGQYLLPSVAGGPPWLPSYAVPDNWYSTDLKGSKIKLTSNYTNKTESKSAHEYSVGVSASWGLFHGSGEVGGEHGNEQSHVDSQNFTLEAELITVSIQRPWFNPLILSMKDWWVTGLGKEGVSDGKLRGMLPLLPTQFVVARDVAITADFSEEDKSKITNAVKAKASGGWGPFSLNTSYGHSSSDIKETAKFDGGTLRIPGQQLIAWVSTIIPPSPQREPK